MESTPDSPGASPRNAVALTLFLLIIVHALYKHITHPLYNFPGPRSAAWSNLFYSRMFLKGRQPYDILALHERYGPVVRVAPNELSFSSASSWQDIYGFRQGHQPFIKSRFYDGGSFADKAHSIVSERDSVAHGLMRKDLSHAFSDVSLKKQEPLIAASVDLLIRQLGVHGSDREGLNIVKWFNLTTFDIIGDLAFGETFGGLEYQKFHFWITLVTKSLRQGVVADTMSRFPLLAGCITYLVPGILQSSIEDSRKHEAHTMALVERRMRNPSPRPDFLTRILEQDMSISRVQLAAHSSDFVIAGSETTATALSCITYYLLKTPYVLEKVQNEIRGAFACYADINAQAANQLTYLHAVCLEGMRMYAPLPFGLPRVVPNGGDTVDGYMIPAGTIVSTNPVAAGLSSTNFTDPYGFRPERWLEKKHSDVLEASQPFSLGPRGCLGRNLAWIELSTVLAKLHFTYDLEWINRDMDWHRDSRMATLWQKPDLIVRVHPAGPRDM
ncbi:cytochrome P450 [Aspergillus stella-maris]|uniref:cytochrome P450 n=1 Tax=Aspergillus stella-maris TaxID=1810926 RepID=UPI003CCE2412